MPTARQKNHLWRCPIYSSRTSATTKTRLVPSKFFVDAGSRFGLLNPNILLIPSESSPQQLPARARFSQRPMLPSVVVPSPLCLLLRSPLTFTHWTAGRCWAIPEVGTACVVFVPLWGWFKSPRQQSPNTLRTTSPTHFSNEM